MFEHLPLITDENLQAVSDKDLAYLQELQGVYGREGMINRSCEAVKDSNRNVARLVRISAKRLTDTLAASGVAEDVARAAGGATAYVVLGVLSAIDRALQA